MVKPQLLVVLMEGQRGHIGYFCFVMGMTERPLQISKRQQKGLDLVVVVVEVYWVF